MNYGYLAGYGISTALLILLVCSGYGGFRQRFSTTGREPSANTSKHTRTKYETVGC